MSLFIKTTAQAYGCLILIILLLIDTSHYLVAGRGFYHDILKCQ